MIRVLIRIAMFSLFTIVLVVPLAALSDWAILHAYGTLFQAARLLAIGMGLLGFGVVLLVVMDYREELDRAEAAAKAAQAEEEVEEDDDEDA